MGVILVEVEYYPGSLCVIYILSLPTTFLQDLECLVELHFPMQEFGIST